MLGFLAGVNPRVWLGAGAAVVVLVAALMIRHALIAEGYARGVAAERATWQPIARDFRTCKANGARQQAAIDRQNASIDSLREDGEDRSERARKAVEQARRDADAYRRERSRIASAKPGGNECEAAAELIRSTLEARR